MKRQFGIVFLFVALWSLQAQAQQFKDFGGYEVHYSALTTDTLSPAVAEAYKISRSKNRVMLNITVIKKTDDGLGEPIEANVEATATNLTKQFREIDMRPIKESDAIYYIGELNAANLETFDFAVTVKVEGVAEPMQLKFRQQFFSN